jgi:hypothetical protein
MGGTNEEAEDLEFLVISAPPYPGGGRLDYVAVLQYTSGDNHDISRIDTCR